MSVRSPLFNAFYQYTIFFGVPQEKKAKKENLRKEKRESRRIRLAISPKSRSANWLNLQNEKRALALKRRR
jgi:hypothetical protein